MRKIIFTFYCILLAIIMTSCGGIKPGSSKSTNKLYETFYVGDAGVQYFIKPLRFESTNNTTLEADFTFRVKKEIQNGDSVIVNFSIITPTLTKEIDSLVINYDNMRYLLTYKEYIYAEKKGDAFESRFSTIGLLPELKSAYQQQSWKLILYREGREIAHFDTPNSTQKKIQKLQLNLFSIL